MADTQFKKALTIAEVAKLTPEEATRYQINRMEYIELKSGFDTAYKDGMRDGLRDAQSKYEPILEQERKEKEQAQRKAEQAQRKAEQERTEKEKTHLRLIESLKHLIESGVSVELVAHANKMSVVKLKKLLGI